MATKKYLLEKVREYLLEAELPAEDVICKLKEFIKEHSGEFAFGFFHPEQPGLEIETFKLNLTSDEAEEYEIGSTNDWHVLENSKAISFFHNEYGKEVILVWKE
jgi:hypothetical protein